MQADDHCTAPRISHDGRLLVFASAASTLAATAAVGQVLLFENALRKEPRTPLSLALGGVKGEVSLSKKIGRWPVACLTADEAAACKDLDGAMIDRDGLFN